MITENKNRREFTAPIDPKLLLKWRNLKRQGDIESISEQSGKSRLTISKAITTGHATKQVIELINSYYGIKNVA
jgi:hypothetical protein